MDTAILSGRDPTTGHFTVGNDAVRAKRRAVERLMADIADAEFGGLSAMRGGDRAELEKACEMLLDRPKRLLDRRRNANSGTRILNGLRKRLLGGRKMLRLPMAVEHGRRR